MRWQLMVILSAIFGSILGGCRGYPQIMNLPYDPGGRAPNTPAAELSPQFTGKYLVFVSDRNGSHDIYLYDVLARKLVDLPGLNALDSSVSDPSISEDAQYIVYLESRLGVEDIYIYDRDTGLKRNLTANLPATVRHPVISADGSRIVFEANENGQWDILVYARSGQEIED